MQVKENVWKHLNQIFFLLSFVLLDLLNQSALDYAIFAISPCLSVALDESYFR